MDDAPGQDEHEGGGQAYRRQAVMSHTQILAASGRVGHFGHRFAGLRWSRDNTYRSPSSTASPCLPADRLVDQQTR